MSKFQVLSIFISLFLSFSSIGQQRIGVDFSTRMNSGMFTLHYQKVLKNRLLYSAGFFFGSNGRSFVTNDTLRLYSNHPIESPFASANSPITDSTGTYSLLDYNSSASSVGVQLGLGYFFEFDVKHGLRTNLNASLGYAHSKLRGYYRSIENYTETFTIHQTRHFVGAISLEAYHTIRLSGRFTLNYGIKLPYYFTIDKARFDPLLQEDLLSGFEPQLSIGFTRVIGKCD